eukprot:5366022-Prymnesium_polylepis.1
MWGSKACGLSTSSTSMPACDGRRCSGSRVQTRAPLSSTPELTDRPLPAESKPAPPGLHARAK